MVYLEEITTEDIEDFLKYLKNQRNNNSNTICTHTAKIKTFFNYALRHEYIKINPTTPIIKMKFIEKPRLYLTYEEVETIAEKVEEPIYKVYFKTLFYTGLRLSESINLKLDDVDLEKELLKVNYGKGGKSRTIPVAPKLKEILSNYLENIRPEKVSRNFFVTPRTSGISERYTWRVLSDALEKLGWKERGITVHTFRHSFAGNLVRKKVSLRAIQQLMGHYDITVTAKYLNADITDLKEAVCEL